jgi:transcriptional regulator with XRE-family HTH domain
MGLGDSIRRRRVALNLTQEDLAARLGWTQVRVSRLERTRLDVGIGRLREVARALETSVDALLSDAETNGSNAAEHAA